MIVLYRPKNSALCDEYAQTLQELVVAHKVEVLDAEQAEPMIQEGKRQFRGAAEIQPYLRELSAELRQEREVSGDACYIDPESGKTC